MTPAGPPLREGNLSLPTQLSEPSPPAPDPRIAVLKHLGMVYPIETLEAAVAQKLDLSVFASILIEETGGGRNEWGHDPENFAGGYDRATGVEWGETVTKRSYLAYRAQRASGGQQGVGPGQLTAISLQEQADALAGCWDPESNLHVSAAFIAGLVDREGLRAGVESYNGSGPAAVAYAVRVLARAATFAKALA